MEIYDEVAKEESFNNLHQPISWNQDEWTKGVAKPAVGELDLPRDSVLTHVPPASNSWAELNNEFYIEPAN